MEEIEVFMFLGFLEAGKTRFIQETMEDPRFEDGKKTLILCCEEGVEEYDESKFAVKDYAIEYIENDEDLTEENLLAITKKTKAERVLVEYNGMWLLQDFFNAMPESWAIYQMMTFMDSNTILNYNANMRQLVYDKINMTQLVVFNRCKEGFDKVALHKMVKAISGRPQIIFEDTSGVAKEDDIVDPLPFDINAPVIEIDDKHFALFYRNINENPDDYEGKTVKFKGIVGISKKLPKNTFVLGRHIMTCCEADIAYYGFVCNYAETDKLKPKDWVTIEATVKNQRHVVYDNQVGPVLTVKKLEKAQKPKQEVATFW